MHLHTTCWSPHTMATTIWPCAQAHHMPVVSHHGDNNMASCASARHAGCVTQWQQGQGLVRKHTTCRLRHMIAIATTSAATKTTKSTSTTIPCAQGHQVFSHHVQAHELQHINVTKTTSQRGLYLVRKRTRLFSHSAQAHKLSAIVQVHKLQRLLWV